MLTITRFRNHIDVARWEAAPRVPGDLRPDQTESAIPYRFSGEEMKRRRWNLVTFQNSNDSECDTVSAYSCSDFLNAANVSTEAPAVRNSRTCNPYVSGYPARNSTLIIISNVRLRISKESRRELTLGCLLTISLAAGLMPGRIITTSCSSASSSATRMVKITCQFHLMYIFLNSPALSNSRRKRPLSCISETQPDIDFHFCFYFLYLVSCFKKKKWTLCWTSETHFIFGSFSIWRINIRNWRDCCSAAEGRWPL